MKQTERQKKENQMKAAIERAIEHFYPEQLLELLLEVCDKNQEKDLKSKMIDLTTLDGGIFLKFDTAAQQDRVNEFITSEIYPYYNEQQTKMFCY